MPNRNVWIGSGIAGMIGILCYVSAVTVHWPDNQLGLATSLLAVSAWPLLSIVFSYGLCNYIGREADGAANRLSFAMAVAGFATVLAMIIVQLAVVKGASRALAGLDSQTAEALKYGLRLIDHGLDVAWDFLIGSALVSWGIAMRRRSGFGIGWGIVSIAFGIALIGLNAATFPWPPNTRGLFDIGPYIAAFIFMVAGRLVWLGVRAQGRPQAAQVRPAMQG